MKEDRERKLEMSWDSHMIWYVTGYAKNTISLDVKCFGSGLVRKKIPYQQDLWLLLLRNAYAYCITDWQTGKLIEFYFPTTSMFSESNLCRIRDFLSPKLVPSPIPKNPNRKEIIKTDEDEFILNRSSDSHLCTLDAYDMGPATAYFQSRYITSVKKFCFTRPGDFVSSWLLMTDTALIINARHSSVELRMTELIVVRRVNFITQLWRSWMNG